MLSIIIESINYSGETANIVFNPYGESISINLGDHVLPYEFFPSSLTPPKDSVYGTYSIFIYNGKCFNLLKVPPPTPTPTPTPTQTKTTTPTPTPTITNTPTFDPCKVPTPTPTTSQTPTFTPTNSPTPTNTCVDPCGCKKPSKRPRPTPKPKPEPTCKNPCKCTPTPSISNTKNPTETSTPTNTNTPTITETSTPTNTNTPTITETSTPTNTPTITETSTPTNTPTITETSTPTITETSTPTNTPTITETSTPTNTPTITPTSTQAIVPSDPTLEIYYQGQTGDQFNPNATSGDTFTQWEDSSANAHNANPIGGGSGPAPQWFSNVQNGLGGVWFNGTTDGLSVNPLTDLSSKSGQTIIMVVKSLNSTNTAQYIQGGSDGNTGLDATYIRQSGSTYNIAVGDGFATGGVVDTNPHIISYVFSGTGVTNVDKLKFYIDGSGQTLSYITNVGTTTNASLDYVFLGVSYTSAPVGTTQFFYNGFLFDVLAYSRALSPSELQLVQQYLSNKWNIPLL